LKAQYSLFCAKSAVNSQSMNVQCVRQSDEDGEVKMEVDDDASSDVASCEASFCLFTKFAKEVSCHVSRTFGQLGISYLLAGNFHN